MKKIIAILLAALMLVAFAACTNTADTATDGNATAGNVSDGNATNGDAAADYIANVMVGTGGATGTYYAFTSAVCQALQNENYKFSVLSTGGSKANIEMLEDGDISFAIVQNDVMNYAYNGTNGFNEAITSFSAVACVYPEVCQLIATKASGITSVADLAGKAVAVGDVGSGVYFNATQILADDYQKALVITRDQ